MSRTIEDFHPEDLIDTAGIAALTGNTRAHVTDRVVKRLGFPKPVINQSQKTRKWLRVDVLKALGKRLKAPPPPAQPQASASRG